MAFLVAKHRLAALPIVVKPNVDCTILVAAIGSAAALSKVGISNGHCIGNFFQILVLISHL